MPRLKVFRTPIGFFDAYVAAPSQKAALEAWGSEKNLFASGRAEQVEDPKLTKAALATPGEVIRVRRGSDEENIAALPKANRTAPRSGAPKAKTRPRPSRAALDRAEKALESAERKREEALDAVDEQIRSLQAKRRDEARKHDDIVDRLRAALDQKADSYDEAMQEWRDG